MQYPSVVSYTITVPSVHRVLFIIVNLFKELNLSRTYSTCAFIRNCGLCYIGSRRETYLHNLSSKILAKTTSEVATIDIHATFLNPHQIWMCDFHAHNIALVQKTTARYYLIFVFCDDIFTSRFGHWPDQLRWAYNKVTACNSRVTPWVRTLFLYDPCG